MRGVIAHPELPEDDHGYPPGGPHLADKPVRFRTSGEQRRQLRAVLRRQPGSDSRWGAGIQRLSTALPRPLQPLADGAARHAQRLGNPCTGPPLLMQVPRSQPPSFRPILGLVLHSLVHAVENSTTARECLRLSSGLSIYVCPNRCAVGL